MVIQAVEIVKAVLDRNDAILLRALEGLTVDELQVQTGPDSNPIGWLMWHLSRVQDNHFSAMEDKEHAWVTEGWNKKFDRADKPTSDRGRGHTSEYRPPQTSRVFLIGFAQAPTRSKDCRTRGGMAHEHNRIGE